MKSTKNQKFINFFNNKLIYEIALFVFFVLIGTIARSIFVKWDLQPFPNFEIIMVLTFISVILLRPSIAIFVPLLSMIFSDLLIGNSIFIGSEMNKIVIFTYSGFVLISLFNIINKDRFKKGFNGIKIRNVGFAASLGIAFVLIYDVWTNIGWWYIIYPHNLNTLFNVFIAGVPFMIYHLVSGVLTFVLVALPFIYYMEKKQYLVSQISFTKLSKITVLSITLVLLFLSFSGSAMEMTESETLWMEKSDETSVKIMILGNNWIIEDNIICYKEESVFSLLQICAERNDIEFDYTYYEEFDSVLVNSINGKENGWNDLYWQYYVNDDIPMVGCDKFTDIKNGDYIRWSFETLPT
jgi:hypothetical protein